MVLVMALCLSVCSSQVYKSSVETAEQIKSVFGIGASVTLCFKEIWVPPKISGWMFLLVPAYPGSSRQKAVKRLCVCMCCYEMHHYQKYNTCMFFFQEQCLTWPKTCLCKFNICQPLFTCHSTSCKCDRHSAALLIMNFLLTINVISFCWVFIKNHLISINDRRTVIAVSVQN